VIIENKQAPIERRGDMKIAKQARASEVHNVNSTEMEAHKKHAKESIGSRYRASAICPNLYGSV
jgi:hypothetical protein